MKFGLQLISVLCVTVQAAAEPSAGEGAAGSDQTHPSGENSASAAAREKSSSEAPRGGAAREVARRKFQEGVRAFEAGRYKDALDSLLEADRAMHTPTFSYNIAITYDAMSDAASALRWYRTYLRELPSAEDRIETEKRISALEVVLQRRGVQQMTVLSKPEGATVVVDGNAVGLTPWTGELLPGRHRVALTLSGRPSVEKVIDLPAHRAQEFSFDLPHAASPQSIAPEATPPPQPDRETSASVGPWTIVTLGAGGVALGGALGFEIARAAAVDRAKEASQLDYRDELDTARSHQTTARILAGVGGALVVTGGVLLWLDLSSSPEAADVQVGCTGSGCFISKRGVF